MRGPYRKGLIPLLVVGTLAAIGCGDGSRVAVDGTDDAWKSSADVRAERRAYDGAPPTIPHDEFGMRCGACHDAQGMPVTNVGFAPESPHDGTWAEGATGRCRQCHVQIVDDGLFVATDWVGLRQDLQPGARMAANSPPTIPHMLLMRENCRACHTGPGAREEIRTSHPERDRCTQCHVPILSTDVFSSASSEGQTRPEGS